MTEVTLTNDFHHTEATIRPREDGTVSERTARRAWRKLCGMTECQCGGFAGERRSRFYLDVRGLDDQGREVFVVLDAEADPFWNGS